MRISHLAIAAFLLMPAAQAMADDSQQPPDPDAIVCRSGEPEIGSHLPGPRVCHTNKEWNDMQRRTQDDLSRAEIKSMDTNAMPAH